MRPTRLLKHTVAVSVDRGTADVGSGVKLRRAVDTTAANRNVFEREAHGNVMKERLP